jgi:hypothetical protein
MAFKIKDGLTIGTKIVTDSSGVLDNPIAITGLTTTSTSFNLLNTNALSVTAFGAATTALTLGANGGTASVLNPTVTLTNATALNINGVNPTLATSSTGTVTLFNTNIATVNAFATATTLNLGGSTAAHTVNLSTGAHSSGTKAINIGTGGTSGGTTTVVLGTAAGGTSTVTANGSFAFKSGAATVTFNTGATGSQTYTWPISTPAANTVLTSDASGNLSWQTAGAASTATSLAGGTAGAVPYQTGAGVTAFLGIGSANAVLMVNSGATAPQWTTSTGTGNNVLATSPTVTTSLVTGSTSFDLLNTTATTVNAFGAATTISIGASASGTTTFNNANVVITGNLTVNGNTTTINSTTLTVDDKIIELGAVGTPTDTTADGGGLSLFGATNKTIIWDSANTNWTASEHWNIATGKVFKINNVQVLSATALGSNITSSSLTSVGTLTALTVAGATTFGSGAVQINNQELQLAPATTARVFKRAVQPATITANTAQTIDSWAVATYRSAKYLIQVVQGTTKYELHEYSFVHDGTTVYATQYAVLETNSGSPIPLTLATSISGPTLTVAATVTNASTTNVTITMERTLFAV